MTNTSAAELASSPWRPIVGRWRTAGRVVGEPETPVVGSDVYELFPGGHFLIHHVDVLVGDQPVRAIEVIGEPAGDGAVLARGYDDTGAMTVMTLEVQHDGAWLFTGGPDIAPAAQTDGQANVGGVRSTLRFDPSETSMIALWERSEDGSTWEPWMYIDFERED